MHALSYFYIVKKIFGQLMPYSEQIYWGGNSWKKVGNKEDVNVDEALCAWFVHSRCVQQAHRVESTRTPVTSDTVWFCPLPEGTKVCTRCSSVSKEIRDVLRTLAFVCTHSAVCSCVSVCVSVA